MLDDTFKRAEIDADPDLNDDGKRRRLARAVRDAVAGPRQVGNHRDTLAAELADAQEAARPRVAQNDVVSVAIWAKLPEDAAAVALLYGEAVAAADWHTCNAIEALPVIHPGRLAIDTLDGLRRERGAVEGPESAKALETSEPTP